MENLLALRLLEIGVVKIYKISGGTGRFAGAKGTITVERTVNMTNGQTYNSFDGFVLVPAQK